MSKLLNFTDSGIYCPIADIFIDPHKPVERAIITHAHSDHARSGHKNYLAHNHSVPLLKHRIAKKITVQGVEYGETINHNGVKISLHPAGHIPGSAQIRLEYEGEVAVISGDYKLEDDGFTAPFESVKCNTFVTESTFALPVYKWKPQSEIFNEINQWWKQNKAEGITSILFGYSLGKAQRLLYNVDHSIGNVFVHDTITPINDILNEMGFNLPLAGMPEFLAEKNILNEALIIAPSSVVRSPLMERLDRYSTANASGWMATRNEYQRGGVDTGFALSDHADWDGLCSAVKLTGAETIYVTHGFSRFFVKWLREHGYNAYELRRGLADYYQVELDFKR